MPGNQFSNRGRAGRSDNFFDAKRLAQVAADEKAVAEADRRERIRRAQQRKRREADDAGKTAAEVAKALTALAASTAVGTAEMTAMKEALTKVAAASTITGPMATSTRSYSTRFFTPEDAVDVIVSNIRKKANGDPDKTRELVGEWLTKTTNELTALLREIEEDD